MPILDKDKPPIQDTTTTDSALPIFIGLPRCPPVPSPESPLVIPSTLSKDNYSENEFDFTNPASVTLLTDTIKKLRTKAKEQKQTIKNLQESNTQHVKDKNQLKRELAEERAKVSQLLSRTITNPEKRKICEDLLKPYMGDTAVKCFIGLFHALLFPLIL